MKKRIQTIATLFIGVIVGVVISTSTGALGTTYLQVRKVANLLGYDVTYKADSRTIELNSSQPLKKEVDAVITDFTSQPIELIKAQIDALENIINEKQAQLNLLDPSETEKTNELNSEISKWISEKTAREVYLLEVGDVSSKSDVQSKLNELQQGIDHLTEILERHPELERFQEKLAELQAEKELLESQQ